METRNYRLLRSRRKTVAIQILPDGEVVVRAPLKMPLKAIEQFVHDKNGWIEKHLPKESQILPQFTLTELEALIEQAKMCIPQRVAGFAKLLGVSYGRVTVRHQKTRWGSCSAKGNLSFNCLLVLMPDAVIDYVVVHELCHRKQMNHSLCFWKEVEKFLPDYRTCKRWLKENGQSLLSRLPTVK